MDSSESQKRQSECMENIPNKQASPRVTNKRDSPMSTTKRASPMSTNKRTSPKSTSKRTTPKAAVEEPRQALSEEADDSQALLPASVMAAQQEADALVDAEDAKVEEGVMDSILLAPKLLQLPQSEVVEKIQDMKERGKQLDLLLLKAESYSQYVANNQKMTQMRWTSEAGAQMAVFA